MKQYIKNFFDKDLLIAIFIFLVTMSAISFILLYLLFPIILFFIVKSILKNLRSYKAIKAKLLYMIVIISFLTISFLINELVYLLFFADLSKI